MKRHKIIGLAVSLFLFVGIGSIGLSYFQAEYDKRVVALTAEQFMRRINSMDKAVALDNLEKTLIIIKVALLAGSLSLLFLIGKEIYRQVRIHLEILKAQKESGL